MLGRNGLPLLLTFFYNIVVSKYSSSIVECADIIVCSKKMMVANSMWVRVVIIV